MTEKTPGYYIPEYPDQRKIITMDVLNMEILLLRREQEQMKELIFCQKKMLEHQSGLLAELAEKLKSLDGWEFN